MTPPESRLRAALDLYRSQHDTECNCEGCNAYDDATDDLAAAPVAEGQACPDCGGIGMHMKDCPNQRLSPYDQWRVSAWIRWSDPDDPRRCPAASDHEPGQCILWSGHPGEHELAAPAAAPAPAAEGLRLLLDLLPRADEYAYIEARVGSDNFRRESRFVVDRRGHPSEGKSEYTNEAANEWLAKVAEAADAVRALPAQAESGSGSAGARPSGSGGPLDGDLLRQVRALRDLWKRMELTRENGEPIPVETIRFELMNDLNRIVDAAYAAAGEGAS